MMAYQKEETTATQTRCNPFDLRQRETGIIKIRWKNPETRSDLYILSGRTYSWNQPFCLLPTHALSWEALCHIPPHMAMALSRETTVHSLPPLAHTLIGTVQDRIFFFK